MVNKVRHHQLRPTQVERNDSEGKPEVKRKKVMLNLVSLTVSPNGPTFAVLIYYFLSLSILITPIKSLQLTTSNSALCVCVSVTPYRLMDYYYFFIQAHSLLSQITPVTFLHELHATCRGFFPLLHLTLHPMNTAIIIRNSKQQKYRTTTTWGRTKFVILSIRLLDRLVEVLSLVLYRHDTWFVSICIHKVISDVQKLDIF